MFLLQVKNMELETVYFKRQSNSDFVSEAFLVLHKVILAYKIDNVFRRKDEHYLCVGILNLSLCGLIIFLKVLRRLWTQCKLKNRENEGAEGALAIAIAML